MQGRRRGFVSWFVEPYRQVRLGLIFLLLNLVFASLIFGVFGYYVWDIYLAIESHFALSGADASSVMAKLTTPIFVGALLLLAFVVITILASVRYTHDIYGPLVSIHRFLDVILEGKAPEPLKLRPSDQLKELAAKLNLVAETSELYQRMQEVRPLYKFLDHLIEGGKPEKLVVREGDRFAEFVTRLNQLRDKQK